MKINISVQFICIVNAGRETLSFMYMEVNKKTQPIRPLLT